MSRTASQTATPDELAPYESVTRAPAASLRAHIREYQGYVEDGSSELRRRRQTPSGAVPLIISLGRPLGVVASDAHDGAAAYHQAFVAGMHDSWAMTEESGTSTGVQVNLTPIGARMLFGVPMYSLTNGVFPLTDLVGEEAGTLPEQLAEAPDWERRFAIIDDVITRRLADAEPVSEAVAWAWRAVDSGGGGVRIGTLADELGWSRKHLIVQFRDGVGLAPKTLSRVVRFNRVIRRLRPGRAPSLAQLAFESGYYDQAHFIRDFRQFAGVTPGEYLRQSLPNGAGVAVA